MATIATTAVIAPAVVLVQHDGGVLGGGPDRLDQLAESLELGGEGDPTGLDLGQLGGFDGAERGAEREQGLQTGVLPAVVGEADHVALLGAESDVPEVRGHARLALGEHQVLGLVAVPEPDHPGGDQLGIDARRLGPGEDALDLVLGDPAHVAQTLRRVLVRLPLGQVADLVGAELALQVGGLRLDGRPEGGASVGRLLEHRVGRLAPALQILVHELGGDLAQRRVGEVGGAVTRLLVLQHGLEPPELLLVLPEALQDVVDVEHHATLHHPGLHRGAVLAAAVPVQEREVVVTSRLAVEVEGPLEEQVLGVTKDDDVGAIAGHLRLAAVGAARDRHVTQDDRLDDRGRREQLTQRRGRAHGLVGDGLGLGRDRLDRLEGGLVGDGLGLERGLHGLPLGQAVGLLGGQRPRATALRLERLGLRLAARDLGLVLGLGGLEHGGRVLELVLGSLEGRLGLLDGGDEGRDLGFDVALLAVLGCGQHLLEPRRLVGQRLLGAVDRLLGGRHGRLERLVGALGRRERRVGVLADGMDGLLVRQRGVVEDALQALELDLLGREEHVGVGGDEGGGLRRGHSTLLDVRTIYEPALPSQLQGTLHDTCLVLQSCHHQWIEGDDSEGPKRL